MLFHKRLYFDEKLLKSKRKVLKKLKQGKLQLGVYVMILSLSENDMIEIIPSYILMQKSYKELDMTVVGIASGREEAEQLLLKMTDDCFGETGNVDLKQYFNNI